MRLRHGCADIREDSEGWCEIECDCGAAFGGFLDMQTAVDELIDHVVAALAAVGKEDK